MDSLTSVSVPAYVTCTSQGMDENEEAQGLTYKIT